MDTFIQMTLLTLKTGHFAKIFFTTANKKAQTVSSLNFEHSKTFLSVNFEFGQNS